MKHLTVTTLLLCVGLCASLLSCSEGGGAIYKTIEDEKEVADSSLSNILTINDVVKTDTNTYFIAAGGIFHGVLDTSTDSVTWTPNENDASRPYNVADGDLCNCLAYYGGTLYGGFVSKTDNLGLYKADSTTLSFSGCAVQTDAAIADRQVTLLRALNGHLFAVTAAMGSGSSYSYDIDYLAASGSTWEARTTSITDHVIEIAYDGVSYWMVTEDAVYQDAADPPSFTSGTETSTLGSYTVSGIKSVFADAANGRIFIPTYEEGVYYSLDRGATWNNIAAATISSTAVSYLTVAGPVDTTADSPNLTYIVGSDGYGYYTLSLSDGTLTRYTDSTIALYLESVRTILVDGTTVFMGTHSDGLWRTTFDTATGAISSDASWTHE